MTRTWLRRIAALDPVTDHHEIYRISTGFEFPFDYQRALEFALFRTYCVPSISALLAATGEFEKRPQQRYDDTALLMAEIAEHGYDSERGRQALRVVNRAHGRYAISNDDMLYVLSTFVHDPVDWIDRFGWRPLHPHEREAAFHYFVAVGKRMGIKDVPPTFADFRRFKEDYEREHFRYSDDNHAIGRYTMELFCSWFPRPLRPAVALGVRAMLDERMLTAFGFRAAPPWVTRAAHGALRARALVERWMPERRRSRLTQDGKNLTYPNYPSGYTPADLGAPEPADIDPRWLRRSG
ncbi:oxygenase MpaB family protein [Saccharopolyspora sp. MS10]|uniref:oxygenase MpaB family protein n=1 Tax=Saccharopolyspora sp. MS10 TaxID=3385973 RepID=UPI0039A1D9EA